MLKRSPNHPGALVRLARIHVVTGFFQKAYTLLRKVPEKDRNAFWYLINGWAHLREGDYAKTDKSLKKSLSKSKTAQGMALSGLSAIYQLQFRKANKVLSKMARKYKSHPLNRLMWGRYWLAKKKARKALRYLHKARRACRKERCPPPPRRHHPHLPGARLLSQRLFKAGL